MMKSTPDNRLKHRMNLWGSQSGLTLIEVLIALVILAVGLIGIAVMHLNAMRFSHSSYYSSVASSIALDLEERLWMAVAEAPGSCVTEGDVDGVIEEMQARWSAGDGNGGIVVTNRVVIPGLEIEVDRVEALADQWTEVGLTMTWADNRFGNDLVEQYSYVARVVCLPPPPPDDDDDDDDD